MSLFNSVLTEADIEFIFSLSEVQDAKRKIDTCENGKVYFTIELKENIPLDMKGKLDDWIFGCDVCQDVCPWNRFSKSHEEPLFNANPELISMSKKDWEEITTDVFSKVFKDSAIKRTKFEGLQRNINFLK